MIELTDLNIYHPIPTSRLYQLKPGDEFVVKHQDEKEMLKIIDLIRKDFDRLMIMEILYSTKKWWQFWKKRKIIGCRVRVLS